MEKVLLRVPFLFDSSVLELAVTDSALNRALDNSKFLKEHMSMKSLEYGYLLRVVSLRKFELEEGNSMLASKLHVQSPIQGKE